MGAIAAFADFGPVSGSEVGARNGRERVECGPQRSIRAAGKVRRRSQEPARVAGTGAITQEKNPTENGWALGKWWWKSPLRTNHLSLSQRIPECCKELRSYVETPDVATLAPAGAEPPIRFRTAELNPRPSRARPSSPGHDLVARMRRAETKKAPAREPSMYVNDARGCIAANRDRFPDHLVQPGKSLGPGAATLASPSASSVGRSSSA